jgi:hypothetical protein
MTTRNVRQSDRRHQPPSSGAGLGPARNGPTGHFGSLAGREQRPGVGVGESVGQATASRNEPTSADVATRNEPTRSASGWLGSQAPVPGRRGLRPQPPRPPRFASPRGAERTERGTGGPGAPLPSTVPDSERTERRAGGCGKTLPRDRARAERTHGAQIDGENEPNAGLGADETNPSSAMSGSLEGGWGLDRVGLGVGTRGTNQSHFDPRLLPRPNEPTGHFGSVRGERGRRIDEGGTRAENRGRGGI